MNGCTSTLAPNFPCAHIPLAGSPLPITSMRLLPPCSSRPATLGAAMLLCCVFTALTQLAGSSIHTSRQSWNMRQSLKIHSSNSATWSGDTIVSQVFAKNIIVSELNRYIFCPVPKATSSNWKFILRKLERIPDYIDLHAAHSPNSSQLRYLADYSPKEVEHMLKDPSFFKFTVVRSPYTRLVSSYMDKLRNTNSDYTTNEYRSFLAAVFGWRAARRVDVSTAPRPSFRSFVAAVARMSPVDMNAHWKPQTLLCGLGIMPYDYIGRVETIEKDAQHILTRLGFAHERFPSSMDIGFPPSGTSPNLSAELYTSDLLETVRRVYATDFALLRYD